MNFDQYETKYQTWYAEFARIVRDILEKAIIRAEGVPHPQSIQYRAKEASHLKPKLEARGLLESSCIKDEIKDLGGVRLIFYTNTDVERFLNSRLIPENFEVDWDQTRVHHPTEENADQRYQAIHYTVSLNEARTALAEYAKFKGLRCEIQIQTIPDPRVGRNLARHHLPSARERRVRAEGHVVDRGAAEQDHG